MTVVAADLVFAADRWEERHGFVVQGGRILATGASLDQIEIAGSSDAHMALIWEKSLRHNWPVTLASGIPAAFTRPGRALIGLSEGGTAALNLAFRHPDVFGACAGHSGDYEMTKAIGLRAVIGRGADAKRMLAENSPLLTVDRLAPRLHELVIYFDCGLADESLGDNRAFDRKLTSLGIAHSYHEFPGSHTWSYWRQHLRDSLKAVTAKMRAPSLAAS